MLFPFNHKEINSKQRFTGLPKIPDEMHTEHKTKQILNSVIPNFKGNLKHGYEFRDHTLPAD